MRGSERCISRTIRRDLPQLRPLDAAKLNEHPEPKGWSIGEVLEHFCIAEGLYEQSFPAHLQRSRPDAGAALRGQSERLAGQRRTRTAWNAAPSAETETH